MKTKVYILLLFSAVLLFTSCRKEETEFIEAPEEETLLANSSIALLIQRTTTNDGSKNNIIDKANCYNIAFPYAVNANSQPITMNSISDFVTVECIFDASDTDVDTLTIQFPITIVLANFTEIIISNSTELTSYNDTCNGENEVDDDIECIDFQYPIEVSIFNTNNELLETINLESDNQLYGFVSNINTNDIVSFTFPIMVMLSDGSEISIADFNELETTIVNAINSCDEDDDYDYNDDDCDDCFPNEIKDLLTSCSDWQVNRLKRNSTDYDTVYDGYTFNFFTDGTLSVYWSGITAYGTYTTSGIGNDLEVVINVPQLPLCNNNWILQEVRNCSLDTEIDLRVGNDDRLQYYNNCN
ncbi:hypothetical protein [uncultured Winogradskyella sp.]|uniref:hypothetical protein n=1 Tax=uncultured Winogradskyella sp. TaxID=395353 RepID=UPI00262A628B|nr:hypothetical protein [uncultured Winogradskyella sp.]|tara:strand:- start:1631 stop:2701 length:1071 start_codon:yes stop_codon:yes gene_type:complete